MKHLLSLFVIAASIAAGQPNFTSQPMQQGDITLVMQIGTQACDQIPLGAGCVSEIAGQITTSDPYTTGYVIVIKSGKRYENDHSSTESTTKLKINRAIRQDVTAFSVWLDPSLILSVTVVEEKHNAVFQ